MEKLVKAFFSLFILISSASLEAESFYDEKTNTILVENILVNGTLYNNVVIVPEALISSGTSTPADKRIKTNLPAIYDLAEGYLTFENIIVDGTELAENTKNIEAIYGVPSTLKNLSIIYYRHIFVNLTILP